MPRGRRPYEPYNGHCSLFQCDHKRNSLHCPCYSVCNGTQLRKNMDSLNPEFGDDAGKLAIIIRALNRLKITGASFRALLA